MDQFNGSSSRDRGTENGRGAAQPSTGPRVMVCGATHEPATDLHVCDCCPKISPYSNKDHEAPNWRMAVRRKSILKNSSAKKSFAATPASYRFQSRSSSLSSNNSQQGALSPAWKRSRKLTTQKTAGHRLAYQSSESEDSENDEGFQCRSHAALLHRVGQTAGRGGTHHEAHLPMWQRLPINQIRI